MLTKTFVITDAIMVQQNEINNTNTYKDLQGILPTNFKITYEEKRTTSSGGGGYCHIGASSTSGLLIGYPYNSYNHYTLAHWQDGSSDYTNASYTPIYNSYLNVEITYNNGVWTVQTNGTTLTRTETYTVNGIGFRTESNSYIKNVIVTPL